MTVHIIVIKDAFELILGLFAMRTLAVVAMVDGEYTMLVLVAMALIVPIVFSAVSSAAVTATQTRWIL